MAIVEVTRPVTGGVDTHLDTHVAAVLDGTGGVLGVESFPTTPGGFTELHDWMIRFGDIERVGVEGSGAYGAGLARFLGGWGLEVIEVDRPNRRSRRQVRPGRRGRGRESGAERPGDRDRQDRRRCPGGHAGVVDREAIRPRRADLVSEPAPSSRVLRP